MNNNFVKKGLVCGIIFLLLGASVVLVNPTVKAGTTMYANNRPGWESDVGSYDEEFFTDAILNPGVSVVTDLGYVDTIKGVWWDRLTVPSSGPTITTWHFATPLVGFGGYWNPGIPGGPGASIEVEIDGSWMTVGEIPRSYTGQFWGFVSTPSFSSVRLSSGSTSGWCETYELDNMVYSTGGNQPPNPPTLISPGTPTDTGYIVDTKTPTFEWNDVPNADYYALYISHEPYGPGNLVFDSEEDYPGGKIYGTSFDELPDDVLEDGLKYRWNMRAFNDYGASDFSNRLYFEVDFDLIEQLITQEAIGGTPVIVDGQFYIILTLRNYIDPITLEVIPDSGPVKVYVEALRNYPVSDPTIARKIGIIDYIRRLKNEGIEDDFLLNIDRMDQKIVLVENIPLAEWFVNSMEMIPLIVKGTLNKLIKSLTKLVGQGAVEYMFDSREELRVKSVEHFENAYNEYFDAWMTITDNEIDDYDMAYSILNNKHRAEFNESMGDYICDKIFKSNNWEWAVNELAKVLTFTVSEELLARVISIDYIAEYTLKNDLISCELSSKAYESTIYSLQLAGINPTFDDDYDACVNNANENFANLRNDIADKFIKFLFFKGALVKCPVELRVYDYQEQMTGIINGEIKEEIPNSEYDYQNRTVYIYNPNDTYFYEIYCKDFGNYSFESIFVKDENSTIFIASNISSKTHSIHRYFINWASLDHGDTGVIIQIDTDGDGIFEQTITSDNELTHDEFMLQTETEIDINPGTLNLNSSGKWITCYIELPEGYYNIEDINISTILLSDNVSAEDHPTNISDYDGDGIPDLMVKFDRQAVQDILEPGENIAITVTGKLFDETRFEGIDYIRVI